SGDGIHNALTLGDSGVPYDRDTCVWRRGNDKDPCPDPDILYTLYTSGKNGKKMERVNLDSLSWVRESGHDPSKETVVLVHGYAGISDVLPMGVLRDAYLATGSYNVYVVDWGRLCQLPCYAAAVHNIRPVGKCLAQFIHFLRQSGVQVPRTTCVGHSLGAHVCGIAANYLLFRMHRIIGLDPARPLIRNQAKGRLDAGDAEVVQVIHTSSTFGDPRRSGHIDFCVNGGRIQPFCANTTNEALCSHIRSVCYLAESLTRDRIAASCIRRCLSSQGTSHVTQSGPPVPMGQHTPDDAHGVYCVNNEDAPYCPTADDQIGNRLCCVPPDTGH
ncbi:hypothetical protein AAG570_004104, partial [Ranatra chinensis]